MASSTFKPKIYCIIFMHSLCLSLVQCRPTGDQSDWCRNPVKYFSYVFTGPMLYDECICETWGGPCLAHASNRTTTPKTSTTVTEAVSSSASVTTGPSPPRTPIDTNDDSHQYTLVHFSTAPMELTTVNNTSLSSTLVSSKLFTGLPLHSTDDQFEKLTQIIVDKNSVLTDTKKEIISDCSVVDFQTCITESKMWIDKSMLIRNIIEEKKKVFMITGPHKWGKTTTLLMLEHYFNMPFENGKLIENIESSKSHLYFVEGRAIKKNGEEMALSEKPLISKYANNEQHLGKHPVIKLNGGIMSYEKGYEQFHTMVSMAFELSEHVIDKMDLLIKTLNPDDHKIDFIEDEIKKFRAYLNKDKSLTASDWEDSIRFLSSMLVKYYKIDGVVILYDEYDTFFRDEYLNVDSSPTAREEKNQFDLFIQNFMFATFKNNPSVFRGVITGILNVVEAAYLSKLNFVDRRSVFQLDDFNNFYGVTHTELTDMMNLRGINEETQKKVVEWFDGYKDVDHPEQRLYCVYSVTGFLNQLELKSYWGAPYVKDDLRRLMEHAEFAHDYKRLRTQDSSIISSSYFEKMSRDDYELLHQILNLKIEYHSNKHQDKVFTLLLVLGYLSASKHSSDGKYFSVSIPNLEIRTEFYEVEEEIIKEELLMDIYYKENSTKTNISHFLKDVNDDQYNVTSLAISLHNYFWMITNKETFADSPTKKEMTKSPLPNPLQYSNQTTAEKFEEGLRRIQNTCVKTVLEIDCCKQIVGNEAFVQAIVTELLTRIGLGKEDTFIIPQFNFKAEIHKRAIPDVYFEFSNISMIIELKYEDPKRKKETSIDTACEQCLEYANLWSKFELKKSIRHVKHVAISVARNCTVEVKVKTFNHEDALKFEKEITTAMAKDLSERAQTETYENNKTRELDDKMLAEMWRKSGQFQNLKRLIEREAAKTVYGRWPPPE